MDQINIFFQLLPFAFKTVEVPIVKIRDFNSSKCFFLTFYPILSYESLIFQSQFITILSQMVNIFLIVYWIAHFLGSIFFYKMIINHQGLINYYRL
jgi:hypothetical protein